MSTIQLTPAQHAILAYAIEHTTLQVECDGQSSQVCGCGALQPAREK